MSFLVKPRKGAGRLSPPRLLPNAVQKKLAKHLALLPSYRHLTWFIRMFELFVVAFLGYFHPSVSLQQLDDFRYFVLFHIKELLFDNAKVVKIILTCKFSAVKVLIIILFLAIPRNPSKIPRKFLARFNLNAYLCHRYNLLCGAFHMNKGRDDMFKPNQLFLNVVGLFFCP